eukprot:2160621-Amphidinium_carterae.1
MSDPQLLDETTPWWFHVVISRMHSSCCLPRLDSHHEYEICVHSHPCSNLSSALRDQMWIVAATLLHVLHEVQLVQNQY